MKILRISLRNLASFSGLHTVDFTREPLLNAGLFSISGPTGAGKSTLLDALCLALYEKTPRLGAAGASRIPTAGGEITQKDPANLLRHGASEGLAEVAFQALDGLPYTARWSLRRARNKPDGAIQASELTLFHGNLSPGGEGIPFKAGKKSEVLPAIAEKVGLSYEQFVRAVLLAQNDFAAFLKADDRERAILLQALTGTERFEVISIRCFERARQEAEQVARLEQELEGRPPLSEEARAEAELSAGAARQALRSAQDAQKAIEAELSWIQQLQTIDEQIAEASRQLGLHQEANQGAALRRLRLAQRQRVQKEAGPLLHQAFLTRQRLTRLHADIAELSTRLQSLESQSPAFLTKQETCERDELRCAQALEAAAASLQEARKLDALLIKQERAIQDERGPVESLKLHLQGLSVRHRAEIERRGALQAEQEKLVHEQAALSLPALMQSEGSLWVERLQIWAKTGGQRSEAELGLQKARDDHAQLSTDLASIQAAEAQQGLEVQQAESDLKAGESELGAIPLDRLNEERQQQDTRARRLQETVSLCQLLSERLEDRNARMEKRDRVTLRVQELDKALVRLRTQQLVESAQRSRLLRESLHLAEAAESDQASQLRALLKPEQPCPVCGARHHPLAGDLHPDSAALRSLRLQSAEADLSHQKLIAEETECQALLGELRLQAKHLAEEDRQLSDLIAATEQGLVEHLQALGEVRDSLPEFKTLQEWLNQQHSALGECQNALRAREERYRLLAEAVGDGRKRLEAARTALVQTRARSETLARRLASLQTLQEERAAKTKELQRIEGDQKASLMPLLENLPPFPQAQRAELLTRISQLDTQVRRHNKLEARLRELKESLTEASQAVASTTQAIQSDGEQLQAREASLTKFLQEKCELQKTRSQILQGRPADVVETELKSALQAATLALRQASQDLQAHALTLSTARTSLQEKRKDLEGLEAEAASTDKAINTWLEGFNQDQCLLKLGATSSKGNLEQSPLKAPSSYSLADIEALNATPPEQIQAEEGALRALADAEREATLHYRLRQEQREALLKGRETIPDAAELKAQLSHRNQELEHSHKAHEQALVILHADDRCRQQNASTLLRLEEQRKVARPWLELNELIGSSDGAKFRNIAQRQTLDSLLAYANLQLEQLSARYRLERLPATLNLIVIDRDLADERRSVHSLSGGETFLVSLSLALGLASLSSNRVRIESLFIDEGFGSLDRDTLNIAMNALMHLESQGRKVGVISHVTEMAEAIPVQIKVQKGRGGASTLRIPGQEQASLPEAPGDKSTASSKRPVKKRGKNADPA